jgi:catechol 2,3-dioxygenase-like lactoylglutathione lyase family enzyme
MNIVQVFSGLSVDDLSKAKTFYSETLGFELKDEKMGLAFNLPHGGELFIYPKPDHQPATFTVLNLVVDNVDVSVDELVSKGVQFEHYDGQIKTDDKGVARGSATGMGPDIAWFKDPAGNILSVLQKPDVQ